MNPEDLKEEISTELKNLDTLIADIIDVYDKASADSPEKLHIASITLYVAQFYTGIENILKRIVKFRSSKLPDGPDSHIELFLIFSENNDPKFPILFDEKIRDEFTSIRRFRHFAVHGYAF